MYGGRGRCAGIALYNNKMIKRVAGIYYSPVGGAAIMTERLARSIGAILDDCSPEDIIKIHFPGSCF